MGGEWLDCRIYYLMIEDSIPVAVTLHPVDVTLSFFYILYLSHKHPVSVTLNPVNVTHYPVFVTFLIKITNNIIMLHSLN